MIGLRLNIVSINVNEPYSKKVNDKAKLNYTVYEDTLILTLATCQMNWRFRSST